LSNTNLLKGTKQCCWRQ